MLALLAISVFINYIDRGNLSSFCFQMHNAID